jgi:hypothetical protein
MLKRVFLRPEALEGTFHSPRSILQANGFTKCGPYLLASSLAAALLDSLFEHPALHAPVTSMCQLVRFWRTHRILPGAF